MQIDEAGLCRRLPRAEGWLQAQSQSWHRYLVSISGYQNPENVQVCQVEKGHAYADLNNNRIFINGVNTLEDERSITHEFLHLAFKHHPLTINERFIETLANQLITNQMEVYEHN
jgi:uncharacterized protein YfaQ (DUF2300 family)